MKKLLLAFFAAVLAVSASAQTTVTFVAGTDKSTNTDTTKPDEITKDGISIAFSNGSFGNDQNYRCGANGTMTITSTIGNIAKVEIVSTANAGAKYGPHLFSTKEGNYTYEGKNGTWTGDAASVVFSTSAQVRMTKIVVTTAAADGKVAKPVIKPASGTYYGDQVITMTAAEGCTVKYKVNDSEEQTYAEAFTLYGPGTFTIVSYAQDADEKKSDEVTTTLELKEIVNYTSIADLRANCTAANETDAPTVSYSFENLLVTGVSGSNIFVSDGTNGYLLYGANAKFLKKGDKISGKVTGSLYMYNSLGELKVTDSFANVTVVSSDNEVTAKSITVDDAVSSYATYEASYVKFANVKFQATAIESKNVTIEDETGDQINIYDQFYLLTETTFDTTKEYDVSCYVVNYKGTVQVYVLDANDIKIITDLKTPTCSWVAKEVIVFVDGKPVNAFTTDSDGTVTYSSSDESVATVDAATGTVTVVGAGSCTITASTPETDNYLAASANYTLVIKEHMGGLESFTNGGFEEWASDAQPKGWKSNTTASSATLEKSTEAHGGEYSVCVKNASQNKRLASKEFLLDAGWYTMQFYAKSVAGAENLAEACPGYAPWDDTENKMGSYKYGNYTERLSSTEWTLVSYTFQLEKQTQINLVVMNPKSSDKATYGDLLVDDFEFRAATEEEIAAAGISSVKVDTAKDVLYNAAGQKVNTDYRGIVIKNGKKYLNK